MPTQSVQLSLEAINDLALRWKKSQIYAIKKHISFETNNEEFIKNLFRDMDESMFDEILKSVFLNSRNLGVGFQKSYNLSWDLNDVATNFSKLESPCLQGTWSSTTSAVDLTRKGCQNGIKSGSRYCQYWREAIDGLVSGLCDDERFARHACITVGDDSCVDVFYSESETDQKDRWQNKNRWGSIPLDKQEPLKRIEQKFETMKVELNFLGSAEGKLFYKMTSKENLSCGANGGVLRTYMENHVKNLWPEIRLLDASPVAVYGEKA